MRRRMRGEGRSFTPGCSVHVAYRHRFNSPAAQPVARSERCPQATRRRAVAFHVHTSQRACRRWESSVDGGYVARCPLTSREVGSRVPRSSKGARGRRGRTRSVHGSKRPVHSRRARIGRSRSVPARRKSVCRSRQAASDSEKRALTISPDLESVRGRESSPRLTSERESATRAGGERASRAGSKRKPITWPHSRSATVRASARMSPDDGRHLGSTHSASSSRRVGCVISAAPTNPARAKAQPRRKGEATGVSEARLARECAEETRRVRTRVARWSGSGIVKCQFLRSSGRGCKPRVKGEA